MLFFCIGLDSVALHCIATVIALVPRCILGPYAYWGVLWQHASWGLRRIRVYWGIRRLAVSAGGGFRCLGMSMGISVFGPSYVRQRVAVATCIDVLGVYVRHRVAGPCATPSRNRGGLAYWRHVCTPSVAISARAFCACEPRGLARGSAPPRVPAVAGAAIIAAAPRAAAPAQPAGPRASAPARPAAPLAAAPARPAAHGNGRREYVRRDHAGPCAGPLLHPR